MSRLTRTALATVLLPLLAACAGETKTDGPTASAPARRPVLINVTSGMDDRHAVTMALQLAGHAVDQHRAVTLFFNVKGVAVCVEGVPMIGHKQTWMIADRIAELQQHGAIVLVCPHCMKAMGITQADLIEGARIATADALFGAVDRGAAVFTY
jgi:predicted peroxiredoxin